MSGEKGEIVGKYLHIALSPVGSEWWRELEYGE